MKRNYLTLMFLVMACMVMSGCKEDKCKSLDMGVVLPDECYDCQWHAPENISVSWTDYNSVSGVCSYFNGHRETLREHIGDTIMIAGWVCSLDSVYLNTWRIVLADYPFTENLEHESNILVTYIISPNEVNAYYLKKLYVKCIIYMDNGFGHPCYCSILPRLIQYDTIDCLK